MLSKVLRFCAIGATSTLVHAALYALFRSAWNPALANLGALMITALANTEANRQWTFGQTGGSRVRAYSRAVLLFAVNYLVTTGAVVALTMAAPGAGRWAEIGVLVAAAAVMTALRFVALDRWVFTQPARQPAPQTAQAVR